MGQSRTRILAELQADWDAVRATRNARLVVLLAESGFGKTRIVQELYRTVAAEQERPGFWPASLVTQAGTGHKWLRESRKRVSPATLEPPPGAHADFLWLGHVVDEGMAGRVDRGLLGLGEELARALDLGVRADPNGPAARMVGHALAAHPDAGADLRAAITELLYRGDLAAGSGVKPGSVEAFWQGARQLWATPDCLPTIVVVEDGHFAGRETVAALEQLASSQQLPFLLLVCAQESQLDRSDEGAWTRRPLGELLDEGVAGVQARPLERLTNDEIAMVYLEAIPDLDLETLRAAVVKVDGNPYYARTLLVAMAEVAASGRLNADWVSSRPARFEGELQLQWDDLELDVRRVLSGIAVLGTQVPERLGVQALGTATDADQSEALAASIGSGWLRRLKADESLRFLERPRWQIAHTGAPMLWVLAERRAIITEALTTLEQVAATTGLHDDQWLAELHLALALAADSCGCQYDRAAAVRSGLASALALRLAADDSGFLDVACDVEKLVAGHELEPDIAALAAESAITLYDARVNQPGGGQNAATIAVAELAVRRADAMAPARPDLAARAHASLSRATRSRTDREKLARSQGELDLAIAHLARVRLPDVLARSAVLHAQALNAKQYGDDARAEMFAQERFELLEARLGRLDRRVTAALGNLAYYANRLDSSRAVALRRELLSRRLELWRDTTVLAVAFAQKELAASLVREPGQMNLLEARDLAEQSLHTCTQLRGARHRRTGTARSLRVLTLLRLGDALEADGQGEAARDLWSIARSDAQLNLDLAPPDLGQRTSTLRLQRWGEARVRLGDREGLPHIRTRLEQQALLPTSGSHAPIELDTLWPAAELLASHLRFGETEPARELAERYGLVRDERFPEYQPRGWRSTDPRHALAGVL